MSDIENLVDEISKKYANDGTRLLDIAHEIQEKNGYIPEESIAVLSDSLGLSQSDILQSLSFYHFFHLSFPGKHLIYLNSSVTAQMFGRADVLRALENETGCKEGTVSPDGVFGIYETSCIGMNDQEPAAIIDNHVFPALTPEKVKKIIAALRSGKTVKELQKESPGDGRNNSDTLTSPVLNHIRERGMILEESYVPGEGLSKIKDLSPESVIKEVEAASLRGRGGAGFPTALKWSLCRKVDSDQKYIFCNADEGEPGTFKDRVLLTEFPEMVFEGMAIAGYAVGATKGVIYVRQEYRYLQKHLKAALESNRSRGLLGKQIMGIPGFDFDIRIQFGAGAYICGEESALIESAEGKRGEPRDRPPFPVESGYLGKPTVVNNVETMCAVVKIFKIGAKNFKTIGTPESSGTKVISISGDCDRPGIYEVPWGITPAQLLEKAGANDPQAIQVGGPSGTCIGPDRFEERICFCEIATGGSVIIIGKQRNLIAEVIHNFMEFFVEESCGSCIPCRTIPLIMTEKLENILNGRGSEKDLKDLSEWGAFLKSNRCGLGQTAGNPILTSLASFPELYKKLVKADSQFSRTFNLTEATRQAAAASGRQPASEEQENP